MINFQSAKSLYNRIKATGFIVLVDIQIFLIQDQDPRDSCLSRQVMHWFDRRKCSRFELPGATDGLRERRRPSADLYDVGLAP